MHALGKQLNVFKEFNIIKLDFDLIVRISQMNFNFSNSISPSTSWELSYFRWRF